MRTVLAALVVLFLGSAASAQIIYMPVQYQYGRGEQYYYGGSDPYVIHSAERTSALLRHSQITSQPMRIYSDLVPYWNAAHFGFTPTDARNEAYLSQPRYFRKSDLLEHAIEIDGTYYVPPAPRARQIVPAALDPITAAPRAPEKKRGVIIIIPKKNLERKTPARPAMFVSAS